jgi:outer membrane protein TolC
MMRAVFIFGIALVFFTIDSFAQTSTPPTKVELEKRDGAYVVDLPTVLRLANAQNLDIQIAREKLNEAKANHTSAVSQFFPWLSPGISYRRHDNLIQAVNGEFINVHKQSYAPGVTLAAQVDIGDAIYKNLAAKQQVNLAEHAFAAQRQETALASAQNYFALLFAQAAVGVANEAIRISTNHEAQVGQAVEAGLIFKGDELRVRTQAERNRLTLRQAIEQKRIAAARLAQTLHLDPAVELVATDSDLAPLTIFDVKSSLGSLIAQAIADRPDRKQSAASIASARATKDGAVFGPLIPTLGAQAFVGGLGGDSSAGSSKFGEQEDYFVGVSWRIGPGGLFDVGRTRAAESRLKTVELSGEKLDDEISRQVVDAFVRVQSLRDQIDSAKRVLTTAEEGLRLAQLRKEFAVGIVLENIQAEQDLTRARFDYLKAVADFNSAQYVLSRAVGKL